MSGHRVHSASGVARLTVGLVLALGTVAAHAQTSDASPPASAPAEAVAHPLPETPAPAAVENEVTDAPEEAAPAPAYEDAVLAELEALRGGGDWARGIALSGFMDFNHRHVFRVDSFLRPVDRNDSFFVGKINLYVNANITRNLRSLIELRFTYAPNGARAFEGGDYTRTATPDYANYERPNNLGGIVIERAYGEYEFAQWLTVRAGQYLTPYGIWNVDHGSPAVIPVSVPYAIGQQLIPERQTGFEFYGSHDLGDRTQLAYHLTLSNGRGPFDSHLDLDRRKAAGGRLRLTTQTDWGDIQFGSSVYYGRYTNKTSGTPTVPAHVVVQRDELVFAGDAKWTLRGVHLQAELVHQQAAYVEGGRPALVPDRANFGTYALAGYRIRKIELMPFFYYQRQDDEYLDLSAYAYGLNYRPLPELVLKTMMLHAKGEWGGVPSSFILIDSQIAWAF